MKRLLGLILALMLTGTALSETVLFGSCPQTGDDPEPIEWLVLEEQDDRTLLLSRYALASLPWHDDREAVTWALMGGNSMDAIMDLFAKLEENNVKFAFETAVKSFEADKVVCEDKDGNTVEFPCTDVLYAMGLKPRWDLVDELRHCAPETDVYIVGDCKQVGGNIGAAINGGFQAALHI